MLTELAGFTLARSLPEGTVTGILTGAYKVYGGVVRDNGGRIVAHLVEGFNPLGALASPLAPVNTAISVFNSIQLQRVGSKVAEVQDGVMKLQAATSEILTLAKGTMLVSGLTLAVATASFLFLNRKLGKIDEKLDALRKEVRAIQEFLKLSELSHLRAALKTLASPGHDGEHARMMQLVGAQKTLLEIHEKYSELIGKVKTADELNAVEEYFTVTALGAALCAAELGLFEQAKGHLDDAHAGWRSACRRAVDEILLGAEPERFLQRRYADDVSFNELGGWVDFSKGSTSGLAALDSIRRRPAAVTELARDLVSRLPTRIKSVLPWDSGLNGEERRELSLLRRLTARDDVLQGYRAQYSTYAKLKVRPSAVGSFLEILPKSEAVQDCFVLVAR